MMERGVKGAKTKSIYKISTKYFKLVDPGLVLKPIATSGLRCSAFKIHNYMRS